VTLASFARLRTRLPGYAASLPVLLALVAACSKPRPKPTGETAAPTADPVELAAAATAPPPAGSVSPGNGQYAHTPVDPNTIKAPPLTPPPEATAGAAGVHFQLLEPGTGDTAGPVDALVLDFSLWTSDGKLVHSSLADPRSPLFSISRVSPQLRGMLAPLRKGARARYWLPKASLVGWKPEEWPDADLIIEVQVRGLTHMTYADATGATVNPLPFQPPDAAGPPGDALSTPNGLHYIYLEHGTGKEHPKPGAPLKLSLEAYAIDGLTVVPLESGLKTATTVDRAPGNLSEVLTQLVNGDRARVWLPMGVGRQVIPKAGSRDVVLDMLVTFQD
jgi:hypothetical protein